MIMLSRLPLTSGLCAPGAMLANLISLRVWVLPQSMLKMVVVTRQYKLILTFLK